MAVCATVHHKIGNVYMGRAESCGARSCNFQDCEGRGGFLFACQIALRTGCLLLFGHLRHYFLSSIVGYNCCLSFAAHKEEKQLQEEVVPSPPPHPLCHREVKHTEDTTLPGGGSIPWLCLRLCVAQPHYFGWRAPSNPHGPGLD